MSFVEGFVAVSVLVSLWLSMATMFEAGKLNAKKTPAGKKCALSIFSVALALTSTLFLGFNMGHGKPKSVTMIDHGIYETLCTTSVDGNYFAILRNQENGRTATWELNTSPPKTRYVQVINGPEGRFLQAFQPESQPPQ